MANKTATEVAKAIVDDLRGAGYYKDPKVLAGFLQGQFERSATSETAAEAAQSIVDDLNGSAYYKDPEVLAGFLEGKFGLRSSGA